MRFVAANWQLHRPQTAWKTGELQEGRLEHEQGEARRFFLALAGQTVLVGIEAGMGTKDTVWSAAAIGILLQEGIGDTIRISLTSRPGGDRHEEVYPACELLQALGLRSFAPSVTTCPD